MTGSVQVLGAARQAHGGVDPEPVAQWKHCTDTVLLFATSKEWLFIFF